MEEILTAVGAPDRCPQCEEAVHTCGVAHLKTLGIWPCPGAVKSQYHATIEDGRKIVFCGKCNKEKIEGGDWKDRTLK